MAKYHSKKTEIDGIIFDSKKEARRWIELCTMQQQGLIQGLQRQVKFLLIPSQRAETGTTDRNGKPKQGKVVERECSYYADFVYYENGKKVVEDAKGIRTEAYKIKRKLMRWILGIEIREI